MMIEQLDYIFRLGKEDFNDARDIRMSVFVEEQGFANEFDDIDEYAYHLVIYHCYQAIATGRMFVKDENTMILGRIATIKEYRHQGIGSKIVLTLENKARTLGYTKLQLSAQQRAQGFYEKLGYVKVGAPYLDEWCLHVTMVKELR